jgi:hypothetical protein
MFFSCSARAQSLSTLAGDVIGIDCYRAVMRGLPGIFTGPVLAPVCYMEHGYSPATVRRGISLARLLGDSLPFPVIRIPWDRDKPWQAVFLHEVAHNLQADLRIWDDVRNDVLRRLTESRFAPAAIATFGRWHKEIFADLAALLLGGPAAALDMAEFMAHPSDKVMTYRPHGAHPTGYVRLLIQAEMLRRMGFYDDSDALSDIWRTLYDPARGARMPAWLMEAAPRAIPAVVDEIAFQPRAATSRKKPWPTSSASPRPIKPQSIVGRTTSNWANRRSVCRHATLSAPAATSWRPAPLLSLWERSSSDTCRACPAR